MSYLLLYRIPESFYFVVDVVVLSFRPPQLGATHAIQRKSRTSRRAVAALQANIETEKVNAITVMLRH